MNVIWQAGRTNERLHDVMLKSSAVFIPLPLICTFHGGGTNLGSLRKVSLSFTQCRPPTAFVVGEDGASWRC